MTSSIDTEPQLEEQVPSASHPPSLPTDDPISIYRSLSAYEFHDDPAFLSGLSSILGHPGIPTTKEEIDQKPDLVLRAQCFYYSRKFKITPPISIAGYKTWLLTPQDSDGVESTSLDLSKMNLNAASLKADNIIQPRQTPEVSTLFSSTTLTDATTTSTSEPLTAIQPSIQSQPPAEPQQPPYPTSFAEIVDLITNNKPIPGIEEIPTTVLELGSSKRDTATRRRKPWEKDNQTDTEADSSAMNLESIPSDSNLNTSIDGDEGVREVDEDESSQPGRVSEMSRYKRKDEGLLRILRPDAVPDSGLIAKD